MDCSPVIEYRSKMPDWGPLLSQNSQQYQACYAPQSSSGLDITANSEQNNQANQCQYPRPGMLSSGSIKFVLGIFNVIFT